MVQVKWNVISDVGLPKRNGYYLTIRRLDYSDGDYTFYGIGEMEFVTGKEGGWNCHKTINGKIFNDHRLNDFYAWADCIDDLKDDLGKEKEE